MRKFHIALTLALAAALSSAFADDPAAPWKLGVPVVTYYAGPGFYGSGPDFTDVIAELTSGGLAPLGDYASTTYGVKWKRCETKRPNRRVHPPSRQ